MSRQSCSSLEMLPAWALISLLLLSGSGSIAIDSTNFVQERDCEDCVPFDPDDPYHYGPGSHYWYLNFDAEYFSCSGYGCILYEQRFNDLEGDVEDDNDNVEKPEAMANVVMCLRPGTKGEMTTEVLPSMAPGHLAQGDRLGPCDPVEIYPKEEVTTNPVEISVGATASGIIINDDIDMGSDDDDYNDIDVIYVVLLS